MSEHTCEVLVIGTGEIGPLLASGLTKYGIDVRLTEADVDVRDLRQTMTDVRTVLADYRGATATTRSTYVVQEDGVGRDGRVFGLGEAAEDAMNLAWKLAAVLRGADDDLLDSYLSERLGSPDHYRTSRLSQELGGRGLRLRAGDRVPDIRLWSTATGTDVQLAQYARGPHWLLLGLGTVTAEPISAVSSAFGSGVLGHVIGGGAAGGAGLTLLDRYGEASRRIGRKGGTVLVVRPDGFLGLRCAPNAEVMTAYLEDLVPTREA